MSYRKKIEHWEGFANTDPLWSILTDPNKKDGKWDSDEFFATGDQEIGSIYQLLEDINVQPNLWDMAIDFGCGVGRLTRAIGKRFEQTTGIDASPQMILMANEYHSHIANLHFVLNKSDRLTQFESQSLSFIYSAIVLQHIPKVEAYQFIEEFCRLIKTGGTVVFQLPTADIRQLNWIDRFRVWLKPRERLAAIGIGKKFHMDMNVFDPAKIEQIVVEAGCQVVATRLSNHTEKAFNGRIEFLDQTQAKDYLSSVYVIRRLSK